MKIPLLFAVLLLFLPPAEAYQATLGPAPSPYQIIDSEEPGGPMFLWNDLSMGGFGISQVQFTYPPAGTLNNTNDNGFSNPIELGFNFPFFGKSYHTCWISTNGFLSFQEAGIITSANTALPTASEPNAVIAPFWDDLCSTNTNPYLNVPLTVFRKTDGPIGAKVFILQWKNVGRKEIEDSPFDSSDYDLTTDKYDFQMILFETGAILFQYKLMSRGGDTTVWHTGVSATVGIENEDGTNGATYLFNGAPSGNAITKADVESPQLAVGFLPAGTLPPWYVNGGYSGTGNQVQTREDTSDEHETNACGGSVVGTRALGGTLPAACFLVALLLAFPGRGRTPGGRWS